MSSPGRIDGSLVTAGMLVVLQLSLPSFFRMVGQPAVGSLVVAVVFVALAADIVAGFIFAAEEKTAVRGFLKTLAVLHAFLVTGAAIFFSATTIGDAARMPVVVALVAVGCLLLVDWHRTIAIAIPWKPSGGWRPVADVCASFSTLFFSSLYLFFLSDPSAGPALRSDFFWIVVFCLLVFAPLEAPRLRFTSRRSLTLSLLLAAISAAIAFY